MKQVIFQVSDRLFGFCADHLAIAFRLVGVILLPAMEVLVLGSWVVGEPDVDHPSRDVRTSTQTSSAMMSVMARV